MKPYPNITKYFNTVPRTYLLVATIWFGIVFAGSVLVAIVSIASGDGMSLGSDFGIGFILYSLIHCAVVFLIFFYLYSCQYTLVRARVGKHLAKTYGYDKGQLENIFAQINQEIVNPRYGDAMRKKKYCSFFITQNWIIGTDGVMVYRANAVHLSNVRNVAKNVLTRYRKGITYYYHVLEITDVKNHVYRFYLRDEQYRDQAYDFLVNLLGGRA